MSAVKWILGAVAVAVCTLVAWKLSEKFRVRQKFYGDFYLFNKRMCEEMNFTRNTLPDVLGTFTAQPPFQTVLNDYRRTLDERLPFSCGELWFLGEEEKRSAEEYFSSLGKTDAHTQLAYLRSCEGKLKELAEKTLSERKKYGTMYIKLGLLTGIAVLILIL